MQEGQAGAAELAIGMHPNPDAFLFQRQFQYRRAVVRQQRLPDSVAFASLARAFGIAGVIGQNFLGAIARGQLQQKDIATSAR